MTWTGENLSALSQQSGAKNLMLAFVVAPKKGSCTVYWNGEPSTPVSRTVFGNDIATIRARGGDAIVSFGGGVDGTPKLELADACTDINAIATAYEDVITTYNLTRIDMNIEGAPAWDTVSIDRRNKALKIVQEWAAWHHRALQISYTLSAWPHGLADSGMGIMRNAVANGVRVDVVNIMPFDYCDKNRHSMVIAVKEAVTGMHDQLIDLYPQRSPAEIWHMLGVTVMPGIDDCGIGEILSLANAEKVVAWAADMGVALLSFWALQRDNGGCPGASISSGRCSGLAQSTWQFTQIFAPFPALRRGA
nr:chitinase [Planosporangium thailandense]